MGRSRRANRPTPNDRNRSKKSEYIPIGWKSEYITGPTFAVCLCLAIYFLPLGQTDASNLFTGTAFLTYSFISVIRVSKRWLGGELPTRKIAVHVARIYFFLVHIIFLYLVGFAKLYLAVGDGPANSCMNQHLDKVSSLYFTLTVFTTTGFGDISAVTDKCRLMTSIQMFSGFVLITVVLVLCLARLGEILGRGGK
ncbi:potassium channel family protein [Streptomyces sp. NPDC005485]|uniref:potassium channel family protein n=1 Tax=Streptomyces sp. NPDC005485 TaxID=3155591 RepID=UPI0033A11D0B